MPSRHWRVSPLDPADAGQRVRWRQANTDLNAGIAVLDDAFVGPLCEILAERDLHLAELVVDDEVQAWLVIEGVGYGVWQAFLPSQASVGTLIVAPAVGATLIEALAELLQSLPGSAWVLRLRKLDPSLAQGVGALDGEQVERAEIRSTSGVDVDGSFETFWAARTKGVRQRVRRTIKRLGNEQINHRLVVRRSSQEMLQAVAEHGRLETSGWKGKAGTAIDTDDPQGRFYIAVMTEFAARNSACAYQLEFDRTVVASLLTVTRNGVMIVLKTAYDERHRALAPGRFLDYLMLRAVFEEGRVSRIENYTAASPEDLKWTTDSRPIVDVDVYRSPLVAGILRHSRPFRRWLRQGTATADGSS